MIGNGMILLAIAIAIAIISGWLGYDYGPVWLIMGDSMLLGAGATIGFLSNKLDKADKLKK